MDEEHEWFHCVATTYGAWLDGDPRGFRTRHHREHVEGDYKNPPPKGRYDDRAERSRASLKQPPVVLTVDERPVAGAAFRDKLRELGAFVLIVSMSGQHAHAVVKLPAKKARGWVGRAKKHVWFELRDHGRVGHVWGKRSKETPIEDRAHQVNAYHYVLRHRAEGAWVWSWVEEQRRLKEQPPPA
ncbi:MAG: hypothetical protein U0746_22440 [Gemmataceae bacterium]